VLCAWDDIKLSPMATFLANRSTLSLPLMPLMPLHLQQAATMPLCGHTF
jgi:hypothetical protein